MTRRAKSGNVDKADSRDNLMKKVDPTKCRPAKATASSKQPLGKAKKSMARKIIPKPTRSNKKAKQEIKSTEIKPKVSNKSGNSTPRILMKLLGRKLPTFTWVKEVREILRNVSAAPAASTSRLSPPRDCPTSTMA